MYVTIWQCKIGDDLITTEQPTLQMFFGIKCLIDQRNTFLYTKSTCITMKINIINLFNTSTINK